MNENELLLYRAHLAGACNSEEFGDCQLCNEEMQVAESLLGDRLGQQEWMESLQNEYDAHLCHMPPPEWWCSRDPGHDGPCAARPM
jgi:hypothetical protein